MEGPGSTCPEHSKNNIGIVEKKLLSVLRYRKNILTKLMLENVCCLCSLLGLKPSCCSLSHIRWLKYKPTSLKLLIQSCIRVFLFPFSKKKGEKGNWFHERYYGHCFSFRGISFCSIVLFSIYHINWREIRLLEFTYRTLCHIVLGWPWLEARYSPKLVYHSPSQLSRE